MDLPALEMYGVSVSSVHGLSMWSNFWPITRISFMCRVFQWHMFLHTHYLKSAEMLELLGFIRGNIL